MTPAEIIKIVQSITYKPGWMVHWVIEGDLVVTQIGVDETTEAAIDAQKRDGTRTPWRGGTKYLNKHMCRQEIVGAIYGAIKDAEIHEMREWFRYRGRAIDNPHIDPDVLWEIAGKASSYNIRQNAMTMEETAAPQADAVVAGAPRPEGCRNRLRDEGKPYPKSGCQVCATGGMFGCPYDPAASETMTEGQWQTRAELRRDWASFCDADPVEPEFAERMETAGLITQRCVEPKDLRASFAEELGIVPGGSIWVLTDLGKRVMANGPSA